MQHSESTWTTFDGLTIRSRAWRPDGAPRAVVVLVHGIGDHSGRYPRVVERLTAAGFAVSSFDQRGHGRSGGPRLFAPSYEALMRDIDRQVELAREALPGIPLFVYGHSHGGSQVLSWALTRRPGAAGIVATSPGMASGVPQPPAKVLMAKVLSRLVPRLVIPLGSPPGALSADPAWIAATEADPLFQEGLSVRIGAEMMKAGLWVLGQSEFPLPLLLMQGTVDLHVDATRNIEFARRLQGDVTLKVWDGMHHELHNDVGKDDVISFMVDWMDGRLRRSAPGARRGG